MNEYKVKLCIYTNIEANNKEEAISKFMRDNDIPKNLWTYCFFCLAEEINNNFSKK